MLRIENAVFRMQRDHLGKCRADSANHVQKDQSAGGEPDSAEVCSFINMRGTFHIVLNSILCQRQWGLFCCVILSDLAH